MSTSEGHGGGLYPEQSLTLQNKHIPHTTHGALPQSVGKKCGFLNASLELLPLHQHPNHAKAGVSEGTAQVTRQ